MKTILYIAAALILLLLILYLLLRKGVQRRARLFIEKHNNVDIQETLKNNYKDQYISYTEGTAFNKPYTEIYKEADTIRALQNRLRLKADYPLFRITEDYRHIDALIKEHNEAVLENILDKEKTFFDTCLKYPLDKQQRRSIVSEEENCLVVSSAGSGKTSSIVGKVKYLLEVKGVQAEKILLISYTNKAAAELTDRVGNQQLKGYTFHKLAIDLIGQVTGKKPSICDKTDALFLKLYQELLKNDRRFKESIVKYFVDLQIQEDEDKKNLQNEREKLTQVKQSKIKALVPDMDGNVIYVRSQQESRLCFHLAALGIDFRYEEPYEFNVADERYSQYKPDFSLYTTMADGTQKRIYLEHFGIDENGVVPAWFAQDCGISYEEANNRYGDGITWKRHTHEKYGTILLETTSADFSNTDVRTKLEEMLLEKGVQLTKKDSDALYNIVLPEGSKQEKAFIRMVVTFITLMKSSCKTVDQVYDEAKGKQDERAKFMIKEIFAPMYNAYSKALSDMGQMDFTDLILQATNLCKDRPVSYEYIIVDEFQDISVDRYQFLKALRAGNPPAKLYCVGDDWQSIYRFSGSDMALFNQFSKYFGPADICKIETTYRFGEPVVGISSRFIQKNKAQLTKHIRPFNKDLKTELYLQSYTSSNYGMVIENLIRSIPTDKSIFLLGRYSFDDIFLAREYSSRKDGNRFYYTICDREIEFLTVHKSKGLEADYVILLQCNQETYGFPSLISDDPVMNYVLTEADSFPYGEERRLFYVAITRAKERTYVMYDANSPSVFVNEFLHPAETEKKGYNPTPYANKKWTYREDAYLEALYKKGLDIKYIANKMGRSQTSITMRLGKLQSEGKL